MPNFSKIAATSEAEGFQYYDIQSFSFTVPGQTVAKVSGGIYHHYTNTYTLNKNRFGKALTSQIMTNVLMNVNTTDSAGEYFGANNGRTGSRQIGSAGGFPIIYQYNIYISSDANNLILTVDVGNGSAVNDVNADTLLLTGKVFFYLAPF